MIKRLTNFGILGNKKGSLVSNGKPEVINIRPVDFNLLTVSKFQACH